MEWERIEAVLTVLLIGFLIGLQRSLSSQLKGEPILMGSRTFALIGLAGYLSGWLGERVENLELVGFAVTALILLGAYLMKVQRLGKLGVTTQFAGVITFLLGLLVWAGYREYGISLAVLVVLLLELKPKLRQIEERISPTEVKAVLLLLVMSFVILPLLPDRFMGPYNLFNPYKSWLMAILIASISFVGYLTMKIVGERHGIFITGAAGGLVSSTAVTVTLSRLYRAVGGSLYSYAGGIAIASTFMYLRVLLEVAITNPPLALQLLTPYGIATLLGLAYTFFLYRRASSTQISLHNSELSKNPLQLSEAIKFALLFGIIFGAVEFVRSRYGEVGVYLVAFISGITDVDAITISLSEMAKGGLAPLTALAGIVIASATNSLVKLGLTYWIGGVRLGWELTKFFIVTLLPMFLALLWLRGIG
ncbi:MAG: MgtC/SapB family protein [Epsilonproteobacteria bacterium]|nr:MgtC/SapB family protein [Campylobacterota bacterium]NPA57173.1 MgtC/SapB family protein [Campylobacterota bacterium]